jgi:oligopeptide transport system substrate-binding protein
MTRRSWRAAALLASLALVAGCGKVAETASGTANGPAHAPMVLRYGNGAEPQDLDSQLVTGVPEHHILTALMEGLVTSDPKDCHPIPGMAKSWEISPDGLVYTFHLRDGIQWSDGTPVTPDDFILAWKRMLSPKLASEYPYMIFNYVVGAKDYYDGKTSDFSTVGFHKPDEHTIVVTLKSPTPFLLNMIAGHYSWNPLPIHTILKYGALDERSTQWTHLGNFVGNGPFMLKDWVPQERLVVVRNPHYWDAARVKLDEVDFIPTEDISAEERMFRAGQLDRTQEVPTSKIDAYKKDHPELLHIDPYLGVYFYRFNVLRAPFGDKRVRKALSLAVDRERLIKDVVRGGEVPAYAVSPPDDAGYTSKAQLTGTIDDARRLLAEAGYPGGKGMPPIQILYNTNAANKQVAEAIQEMWRSKLGVECELVNEEWKVYLDSQHSQNFQIERAGWIADYSDPNVFLEIWETGNGNNDTNWGSPEYDRIFHEALNARDNAQRYEDYQKLDAILVDECPIIPMYYYTRPYLMSTKVKGTWPNALDIHPYQDIYIEN